MAKEIHVRCPDPTEIATIAATLLTADRLDLDNRGAINLAMDLWLSAAELIGRQTQNTSDSTISIII